MHGMDMLRCVRPNKGADMMGFYSLQQSFILSFFSERPIEQEKIEKTKDMFCYLICL